REVDVVDDEADRWVRRAVVLLELADAAQLKVTSPRAFSRQVQVRDAANHFLEVLLRRGFELFAIEHGDADREILDARLAKVGRDDDLLGTLGLRERGMRSRRRNDSERRAARGTQRPARISSTSETRFN